MRWHSSRRYPACCACSSSCRCFMRRNEFNFCSAHSKGRFDADPSEGCKVQKCIPQFQQRRCKPGFQCNAAPEGRNPDILQRVPRGPQIIICNVQPLCQHLKCIRVSQCSFRKGTVPVLDETLQNKHFLRINGIAAALLECTGRTKRQLRPVCALITRGADQNKYYPYGFCEVNIV